PTTAVLRRKPLIARVRTRASAARREGGRNGAIRGFYTELKLPFKAANYFRPVRLCLKSKIGRSLTSARLSLCVPRLFSASLSGPSPSLHRLQVDGASNTKSPAKRGQFIQKKNVLLGQDSNLS